MKKFLYIIIFLISCVTFAQNETLFEQGNVLYNQGNYKDAIQKYEAIIANGEHSSELYFNLGNAYYKLNQIAPSIYYYEKAMQLSPNDKELKNNIAFARNMTIDDIENTPEFGFSKFVKTITNVFNYEKWAMLSILMIVLFVTFFIVYYYAMASTKKRLSFVGSMTFLILSISSLALAFHSYDLDKKDQPAIVFVQESIVKSEPNLRSSESFKLHEGTKVQILDTVNNWKKIKLADGKTGWVSNKDIRAL